MTPKKIALVLVPLAAFALGWTVRTLLAPAPAEKEAAVAMDGEEEPAAASEAGGGNAARARGAGGGKKPKQGGGAGQGAAGQGGAGRQGGAGKPGAAARQGGANAQGGGGGKAIKVETSKLEVTLGDTVTGQPPASARIHLRPTAGDDDVLGNLRRWARSTGDEALVALLSDDGAPVGADGKAVFEEVPAMAMTLDVWSEQDAFPRGAIELGKLPAKRTKWAQVDIASLGADGGGRRAAKDGGAPTARERRRDPAELVPFHGLVLTSDEEPQPVAGARVQDGGRTLTTSDEEGRFELPYDAALAPTVRVVGEGLGPAIVQVGPGHATPEEALAVKLRPSASMELRILTAEGRPAAGIRVELATDMVHVVGEESGFSQEFGTPAELGAMTWEATTNNFGAAFLEGLPAGAPISIVALRAGAQAGGPPLPGLPAEVTLAPGEKWSDEWHLPEQPELRGRVVDHANEPIAGAPIWLVRSDEGALSGPRYLGREDRPAATATSAEDGAFVFEDVTPGVWLVGVGLPAAGARTPWQLELDHLARPVEVPEPGGPELGELLLRVGRGLTMHGVVLGADGQAAAGVLVTALEGSGRGVAEARTDATGAFTLGPLSKGLFRLIVAAREGSGIQDYGPIAAGSRDLVLKVARATPLLGRVVSSAGDPRAASVAIFQAGVLRAQVRTLEPEQPGVFEAGGLEPGAYDFVATTEDGQVALAQDVAVGPGQPAGAVRMVLAPGGLVTVRQDGPRPWAPFAFVKDGRPIALGILHRGVPRALFAPVGTLVVRLEGAGGVAALEETVEVTAGGAVELALGGDDASQGASD